MIMFSSIAKVSVLSIALLGTFGAYAKESTNLVVKLDSIVKIHSQEERGDELYFSITEYSNKQGSDHYQVPNFPTHWLSSHLSQVDDVSIWQKNMSNGEAIELIISLVERDVPPWNVDDLIGSIKLKLKFENNQLEKEWSIPNQANTSRVPDTKNTFKLLGDEAQYTIVLKVEELDELPAQSPSE